MASLSANRKLDICRIFMTEENLNNRFHFQTYRSAIEIFAMLFQDYVPMPQLRMYLNLVYNTGLARIAQYADSMITSSDCGITTQILESIMSLSTVVMGAKLSRCLRNSIGAEIYNIFDNRNSIGQYLGT
jgi:hypothetical protein